MCIYLKFLGNYNWLNMWFRYHYPQRMVLYAENCPEQPQILQNKQPEKVVMKKVIKKKSQNSLTYHPKIIKSHRFSASMREKFQLVEHDKQLSSLYERIKNCKSLSQRKKDHNDPIIYPSYFIRQQKRSKDARIDGYFRQLVTKKFKKGLKNIGSISKISSAGESFLVGQKNKSEILAPKYYQQYYLKTNNDFSAELPNCKAADILRYLESNQIFKITDIFLLKARMKEYYNERIVNQEWIQLLRKLGLFNPYQ